MGIFPYCSDPIGVKFEVFTVLDELLKKLEVEDNGGPGVEEDDDFLGLVDLDQLEQVHNLAESSIAHDEGVVERAWDFELGFSLFLPVRGF